uniref:Uncharacterized protein n=1 Tax=Opuntia streptacantha TaxID=393608 RepID=A0A7C9AUV6_OPUST
MALLSKRILVNWIQFSMTFNCNHQLHSLLEHHAIEIRHFLSLLMTNLKKIRSRQQNLNPCSQSIARGMVYIIFLQGRMVQNQLITHLPMKIKLKVIVMMRRVIL